VTENPACKPNAHNTATSTTRIQPILAVLESQVIMLSHTSILYL